MSEKNNETWDEIKNRKWGLLAIPLVIGLAGFLLAGMRFADALFSTICLYGMEIQDTPPNFLVEIARWTAPIATASGFLMVVSKARNALRRWWSYVRGNSIAVYGPETDRRSFLEALKGGGKDRLRGIEGDEDLVRAHKYVLLNDEEKNFGFYAQNKEKLKGRTVYMKSDSLRPQAVRDPGLRLFSPEETAARRFWKEHCLYGEAKNAGYRLKLVMIGFGRLGEELLNCAVQYNVFSPEQCVEYHVFGGDGRYAALHPRLSELEDRIVFHTEPWYACPGLPEEAARILVVQQEDQAAVVTDLLLATLRPPLYVFAADASGAQLLEAQERLILCPWQEPARDPADVLSQRLYDDAKRLNLRYAHIYGGTEETEENKEKEWAKLDSFTRYSNVSAADYHEIRLRMLREDGESTDAKALSDAQIERLAQLEHMRWCRYHWLNGWSFGTPANGKNKDPKARIHVDLRPYGELSEGEKEKDRENIRLLLSE